MALEGFPQSLRTPEEELAYLREQVAQKEAELSAMRIDRPREHIAHETISAHRAAPIAQTHAPEYRFSAEETDRLAAALDPDSDDATMRQLKEVLDQKGAKNAFAVLDQLQSPHLDDDFHRYLVQLVVDGMPETLVESAPTWQALHLLLYEVSLPETRDDGGATRPLRELVSGMEQVYAGLLAVADMAPGEPDYLALELAVPVDSPHLRFCAAVPRARRDLFEKQVQAVFPDARLTPQPNDYNVFVQDGSTQASYAGLSEPAPLPIKAYDTFDVDPLAGVLGAFGRIAPEGEGAALQIVFKPDPERHAKRFRRSLKALSDGMARRDALNLPETFLAEAAIDLKRTLFSNSDKDKEEQEKRRASNANAHEIQLVEKKLSAPIVSTNLRLVASADRSERAEEILRGLEAAFNQFELPRSNRLVWHRATPSATRRLARDFAFRLYEDRTVVPLSLAELATLYHYPATAIAATPNLVQARYATAAAPPDLPSDGVVLGTNEYRGQRTMVRLSPADRLRHLYVIGQTGTGKSSFMTTLIAQDIANGDGCCFIDPHGNDVVKILEAVPPERYEDVIYFDPAHLDRPFGLNLLEYDADRPEQKTFIVNELLAIFRRLYGDTPESMGPAFEQYFRNAALLVMEDPASGSTMMDIARVLSDTAFRSLKLSRSRNPIINQFWNDIATKAGGDASLENIVPYITNKFDDFTANDFMRPIIGQQESTLRFREIMDTKKILLVNLSKGRLGERNANLLGLIIVGKLFMAALSRADQPGASFPPFYTYIDEFQNITTDSIPAILSEARKYKLSLTLAHQFLAQIDPKARDAVFGNVGSMAVFRVGQEDGETFEKLFAPVFGAQDFTSIENLNAYTRILANGVPQRPFNFRMLPFVQGNPDQIADLRALSYLTYGRDRATIEAKIRARYST